METVEISKTQVYIAAAAVIALSAAFLFFNSNEPQATTVVTADLTLGERFAILSSAHTSLCAGPGFISAKSDGERLQGACCSAMDFHRYAEQVEGLKKYEAFEVIPPDPYDIPVSLANMLLDYQKTISLIPEQQEIYDEAVALSHEGGPCCCKCWRWYAFEGLAKYLITEHSFSAEQIAEVWDLEDGCGGKGHVDNMHGA